MITNPVNESVRNVGISVLGQSGESEWLWLEGTIRDDFKSEDVRCCFDH